MGCNLHMIRDADIPSLKKALADRAGSAAMT